MDFKKLVTDIVTPLVDKPEEVSVNIEQGENDLQIIKVLVANEDLGRIIGRKGSTASAIREIVGVGAKKERLHIRVQLDSNSNSNGNS